MQRFLHGSLSTVTPMPATGLNELLESSRALIANPNASLEELQKSEKALEKFIGMHPVLNVPRGMKGKHLELQTLLAFQQATGNYLMLLFTQLRLLPEEEAEKKNQLLVKTFNNYIKNAGAELRKRGELYEAFKITMICLLLFSKYRTQNTTLVLEALTSLWGQKPATLALKCCDFGSFERKHGLDPVFYAAARNIYDKTQVKKPLQEWQKLEAVLKEYESSVPDQKQESDAHESKLEATVDYEAATREKLSAAKAKFAALALPQAKELTLAAAEFIEEHQGHYQNEGTAARYYLDCSLLALCIDLEQQAKVNKRQKLAEKCLRELLAELPQRIAAEDERNRVRVVFFQTFEREVLLKYFARSPAFLTFFKEQLAGESAEPLRVMREGLEQRLLPQPSQAVTAPGVESKDEASGPSANEKKRLRKQRQRARKKAEKEEAEQKEEQAKDAAKQEKLRLEEEQKRKAEDLRKAAPQKLVTEKQRLQEEAKRQKEAARKLKADTNKLRQEQSALAREKEALKRAQEKINATERAQQAEKARLEKEKSQTAQAASQPTPAAPPPSTPAPLSSTAQTELALRAQPLLTVTQEQWDQQNKKIEQMVQAVQGLQQKLESKPAPVAPATVPLQPLYFYTPMMMPSYQTNFFQQQPNYSQQAFAGNGPMPGQGEQDYQGEFWDGDEEDFEENEESAPQQGF